MKVRASSLFLTASLAVSDITFRISSFKLQPWKAVLLGRLEIIAPAPHFQTSDLFRTNPNTMHTSRAHQSDDHFGRVQGAPNCKAQNAPLLPGACARIQYLPLGHRPNVVHAWLPLNRAAWRKATRCRRRVRISHVPFHWRLKLDR